jgi:nanoRNase/pAp phosphatase (c-di-AMP/oligoRNAs hydrolase)
MDLDPFARRLEDHDSLLLVTHRHADRDSLGSAIALDETLDADTTICTPDGVAKSAQPLLEGRTVITVPELADYDAVVVIDTPSLDGIAPIDPTDAATELYLVDHHTRGDLESVATAAVIDTEAASTADPVYRVIDAADWGLPPAGATVLVAGLVSDTGFLATAGAAQVGYLTDLLVHARGGEQHLASLFSPPESDGKRMARVKGVLRADGYKAGDTVVAVTRVGSDESAAARALLQAGADCAFVASDQGDHVRVVGRCTDAFADRLSLGGELFPQLAERPGLGGGHDGAGTVQIPGQSVPDVEAEIVAAVEQHLGVTFGEVA